VLAAEADRAQPTPSTLPLLENYYSQSVELPTLALVFFEHSFALLIAIRET